jgi:hypothetical protein
MAILFVWLPDVLELYAVGADLRRGIFPFLTPGVEWFCIFLHCRLLGDLSICTTCRVGDAFCLECFNPRDKEDAMKIQLTIFFQYESSKLFEKL